MHGAILNGDKKVKAHTGYHLLHIRCVDKRSLQQFLFGDCGRVKRRG